VSRLLPPLFAVAYLLLAHAAAWRNSPTLALAAGLMLVLLLLGPALVRGRWPAWLALAAAIAGLVWLQRQSLGVLPLYAPPVLFNLFLAWLFGHTLLGDRRPLIERIARVMGAHPEPLDPAIIAYTRRLTLGWTVLFLLVAATSFVLALLAVPDGLLAAFGVAPPWPVPQSVWSLFANVISYLLVGALFVVEFAWRRRRFDNLPYASFAEFIRRLVGLGPAAWRGLLR
jgi:uncharacterized membrane protein